MTDTPIRTAAEALEAAAQYHAIRAQQWRDALPSLANLSAEVGAMTRALIEEHETSERAIRALSARIPAPVDDEALRTDFLRAMCCGSFVDGRRVWCDDPSVYFETRSTDCECRAALAVVRAHDGGRHE